MSTASYTKKKQSLVLIPLLIFIPAYLQFYLFKNVCASDDLRNSLSCKSSYSNQNTDVVGYHR